MASLNMAQLMSDDALKLIHIIRLRQETAVNPDDLSSGHKGVDFGTVDQQHLNIAWVQASRLFKWRGNPVKQSPRFRIPQNLLRHERPSQQQKKTEARRVGKTCVSTCKYRWSLYHNTKNHMNLIFNMISTISVKNNI